MGLMAILMCMNLASCSNEESSYKDLILLVGESKTLEGTEVWKSDNVLIATVEGNKVEAIRKGETFISSSNHSFKITVNATNNDFKEPYLKFGCNLSELKKEMNQFTVDTEIDDAILYKGIGNVAYYMYGFKNQSLYLSCMLIPTSKMNNLVDFLSERYISVSADEDDDYISMTNPEKDMVILISAQYLNNNYYYSVAYSNIDSNPKGRSLGCNVLTDIFKENTKNEDLQKKFTKDLYLQLNK